MERITKEQLAGMLNNVEVGNEDNRKIWDLAYKNGLVICFGYSDDNLELRGAIDDEIGAYDGGEAYLYFDKNNEPCAISNSDERYEDLAQALLRLGLEFNILKHKVIAEWCPKDLETSWRITATVPYASFNVYEDGDLFCVGCVIDVNYIK